MQNLRWLAGSLVHGGDNLICCGEKMELLDNKRKETGHEKHVPVVGKTDNRIKIKIGSVLTPWKKSIT